MQVFVKVFANLRDYLDPKPPIGEKIPIHIHEGATVEDIVKELKIPLDQVAIVFINGVGKTLRTQLHDGDTVSIFSPVGGG